MKVAKIDSIVLEIVLALQMLLEAIIVPSNPVVPLLEEVVRICRHQSLQQDHVCDDL